MSLSFFCGSWNEPIGRSNWIRVFAYSSADAKQEGAAPITPQMIPKLASLSHVSGPRSPFTSGSPAPAGSRTSSMTSSDVTLARRDSFLWMSGAENPGVSHGTTKPRIPPSVLAHTIATSEQLPFVIHIFVPDRTQSSPSRLANVRIDPGSLPLSGSLNPKHPIASPDCSRGSHSALCSSDPNVWIANIASALGTATNDPHPLSPASRSSWT